MQIHPQYRKTRQRIYIVGTIALVAGVFGSMLPVIPGVLAFLLGLSILSLQSRRAHQFLAKMRARHPAAGKELERAEEFFFRLFNLTTHSHDYETIPGRDGKELSALVEVSELHAGVAVVLHSASMVMEAPATAILAEAMRARGLTVIRFDAYHGMGESGGPFASFTASNFKEDLEDVLAWAKAQSWWQGPLVLTGHSVGGLVAARYTVEHHDEVQELYLLAPTIGGASYEAAYKAENPEGFATWEQEGIRTVQQPFSDEMFGIGFTFVEDLRRYNIVEDAPALTMPVHIYLGDFDHVTPRADVDAFIHAIGPSARLTTLKGVSHVPRHHTELRILRDALLRETPPLPVTAQS